MKLNKLGLIGALCTASFFGGTSALAGDTANVAVSASVTGTCKFNSGGAISFTLDPTSTVAAAGTISSSPAFWCTKGTPYTVSGGDGANSVTAGIRRMKHATLAEFIPYTFTGTTATGTGAGKTSPIPLTLSAASVANVDFINASAGNYADTVVVTISP